MDPATLNANYTASLHVKLIDDFVISGSNFIMDVVDVFSAFERRSADDMLNQLADSANAVSGSVDSDFYGTGRGLNEFEMRVARMLGKEAGL